MKSLELQDAFQPYYDGRQSGFAKIRPETVEMAAKLAERIDEMRRKEQERRGKAA